MRYNFALALPVVAALLATAPSVRAQTTDADTTAAEQGFAAALGCTKQRAAAVALKTVDHGARVVFVIFDREDRPIHWSVDLVSSTLEYEVWVSIGCKVIRTITGPL
jgi:hypothetical protein